MADAFFVAYRRIALFAAGAFEEFFEERAEVFDEARELLEEFIDGINDAADTRFRNEGIILGDGVADLLLFFLGVGTLVIIEFLHHFLKLFVGLVPVVFRVGGAILLHVVDEVIETRCERLGASGEQQDGSCGHQRDLKYFFHSVTIK